METKKRKQEILADLAQPASSQRRLIPRDSESPPPPPPPGMRDWAALPRDVQCAIFLRLPHADIFRGVGLACKSWRRISTDEPALWRHIDIAEGGGSIRRGAGLLAMARAAVDRSAGRCDSYRGPADCSFLVYLAARAPSLKGLHVTSDLDLEPSEEFVEHVVKKLSLLERLVLSQGYIMKNVLRAFLDLCPRLTLLDAGGCRLYEVMGSRLQARFYSTIKEVKLPQQTSGGCGCCRQHAVRYAEEHDY
ncbi:unnamed protein product [Urochloa humidicola]